MDGTGGAHPDHLARRHRGSISNRHRPRRVREHIAARGGHGRVRAGPEVVVTATVGVDPERSEHATGRTAHRRRGDGETGRYRLRQRPRALDGVHDAGHGAMQRVRAVQHVTVGEVPDGRLHGGGRLVEIGQDRFAGVGVVLIEQPRHVVHVGDVGFVPLAQAVPDSGIRSGQDVDAVQPEVRAAGERTGIDDAGEALVLGVEAGGGARGIGGLDRVKCGAGVGDEPADPPAVAGAGHHQLGVAPYRGWWPWGRPGTKHSAGRSGLQQQNPQREPQKNRQTPPSTKHRSTLHSDRILCRAAVPVITHSG